MEREATPVNLNLSIHPELSKYVISEIDLLRVLNLSLKTLSDLRLSKEFPVIILNRNNRAYWIEDIREWLKAHRQRQ